MLGLKFIRQLKVLVMKKKILIPTDFSTNSWNSIQYARKLFRKEECIFYILNAFTSEFYTTNSMMTSEPGEKFYDLARKNSEEGLSEQLELLNTEDPIPNHTYKTISRYNLVLDAIKKTVEEEDIGLIAISNKGKSNASNKLFGSMTIQVMEKVRNCPVLVIPSTLKFKAPNEIVFPTSFKTHFKQRELIHLYEISRITGAPIRVLHVNLEKSLSEKQKKNKKLLEECLEGLEVSFHWMDLVEVQKGVQSFVQSRGSEMIAFINKKHAFFNTIFSFPMVKYLGHYSKIPVLVMHDLRN